MAANTLIPFGFRVASQYNASPGNFSVNTRSIAYNNANNIGYGDPVKSISTGYIDLMAAGGTTIHGIFAGCEYPSATAVGGYSFQPIWAAVSGLASTATVQARVYNDPMTVFLAQANGAAMTISKVGYNIDILAGTPNAQSGIATSSLDATTVATTGTLPFKIIGILGLGAYVNSVSPLSTYVPTNDNQFVFVKMNTSDLVQTTGI